MIPGAPVESRWLRSEPQRHWPAATLDAMIRSAFPTARVIAANLLALGRRNANFKVNVSSSSEPLVLRIYQHDESLCQKEVDIIRLVQNCVPVPKVIYAQPRAHAGLPPFVLMSYLGGVSFRQMIKEGDSTAIAQASRSAGQILAHIGRFRFEKGGWLGPGPSPTAPLLPGDDAVPRFIDACLASEKLQARLPHGLCDRAHVLMWSSKNIFDNLSDDTCLVHGDFNKRNLLVSQEAGSWKISGVLDWEFAIAGSPLGDCGNLLRYERRSRPIIEPHFSEGYLQEGGELPPNWLRQARLLDMIALCESLTRQQLPEDVSSELVELVRSTVEDRDPHL